MREQRLIRKYANRRLYDTAISSYVTLDDVRELILAGIEVKVIDARSKNDLTHTTLLQIINEQEEKGQPMFTSAMLQNIIRFYGNALQNNVSAYLEQSLALFAEQQHSFREQLGRLVSQSPLTMASELAEQHRQFWQKLRPSAASSAADVDGASGAPKSEY